MFATGPLHITDDVTGDYDQTVAQAGFMSGTPLGVRFNLTGMTPPMVVGRVHNMYNAVNKLMCDARF
jgi:hypothetical protein